MAAPKFAPVSPVDDSRVYGSPDIVPASWKPDRPGDLVGLPARGRATGLPRSRPGIRDQDRQRLPRPVAAAARRTHGRRDPGLPRHRPAARFDVQQGAGRARPDDRLHDLGVSRQQSAFGVEVASDCGCSKASATRCITTTRARALADMVPEATLRMTPAAGHGRLPRTMEGVVGRMSQPINLTEEQHEFRAVVRRFAEDKIAPRAAATDERPSTTGMRSRHCVAAISRRCNIPEEYGGPGCAAGDAGDRRRGVGAGMCLDQPDVPHLQARHVAGDQLRIRGGEGRSTCRGSATAAARPATASARPTPAATLRR